MLYVNVYKIDSGMQSGLLLCIFKEENHLGSTPYTSSTEHKISVTLENGINTENILMCKALQRV